MISHETLKAWSGISLVERTRLFHRMYPDARIKVSALRKLYLENQIKLRKLILIKSMPP